MSTIIPGQLRHLFDGMSPEKMTERGLTESREAPLPFRLTGALRRRPVTLMMITQSAYWQGSEDLSSREEEAAGLLLGPKEDDLITHYVPNAGRSATRTSVTLDAERCNAVLAEYVPLGLDLKGIWHIHPSGITSLSLPDLDYVASLFDREKNAAATKFYMPIQCDGLTYPFVLSRHDPYDVQPAGLLLV